MPLPANTPKVSTRLAVSDDNAVVDKQCCVHRLYGQFLSAVPRPAYSQNTSHLVLKHKAISAKRKRPVQERLAL